MQDDFYLSSRIGINRRFFSGIPLLSRKDIRRIIRESRTSTQCLKLNPDNNPVIVLPSYNGNWLKVVPILVRYGFNNLVVYLQDSNNEKLTDRRTCIVIPELNVLFVPNYKCGYSSIRTYAKNYKLETDSPGSTRKSVNRWQQNLLSEPSKKYLKLSIVRHPVDRFISFYNDKIIRKGAGSGYSKLFTFLAGNNGLAEVIEMIGKIPDEFRDRHFKSQSMNLFLNDYLLVNKYFKIEDGLENILSSNDLPGKFPHVHKFGKNTTLSKMAPDPGQYISTISEIYKSDITNFNY